MGSGFDQRIRRETTSVTTGFTEYTGLIAHRVNQKEKMDDIVIQSGTSANLLHALHKPAL
jgi:hypothetical protein